MVEKNEMKRGIQYLCLFAIAFILAISAAGVKNVSAATKSGSCGDKATYKYNTSTKTLTISGSGKVEHPDEWADFYQSVKKLVIGDKITDIGTYNRWSSLKTVTLGKKVKKINKYAFYSCGNLTTVDMGDSAVTTIGLDAFAFCGKLKSVTFSKKLTKIYEGAFSNCTKLTSISLPSSLKLIGKYAFSDTGLKKITIPKKVTSIGTDAFINCHSLMKITVSISNTKYSAKDGVLYNKAKTKLIVYPIGETATSFTVPSTVKTIESHAFDYNKNLKSVTIGPKVTKIGDFAFYNCSKLQTVVIGAKVKTVGRYAFSECTALKTVKFKGSAPEFDADYSAFSGDEAQIFYPASEESSWETVCSALNNSALVNGDGLTFTAY